MVAVMLLDKTVSFRSAHDKPRMQDPAALQQRAKVRAASRPERSTRSARGARAIVELTLADGTQIERVDQGRCAARPRIPCRAPRSSPSARDLMAPRLGKAKSAKLIDTVLALERVKNVRQLRPLLQRAG